MTIEQSNQAMKVGSWRLDQSIRVQEAYIRAAQARLDSASKQQDIIGKQIKNMQAGVEYDRMLVKHRNWKRQLHHAKVNLRKSTKKARWLSNNIRQAERIKLGHGLRDDFLSSSSSKIKKCMRSLKNVINNVSTDVYSAQCRIECFDIEHWVAGRSGKWEAFNGPSRNGTIWSLDLIEWTHTRGVCPIIGSLPYIEFSKLFALIETKAASKYTELVTDADKSMEDFVRLNQGNI